MLFSISQYFVASVIYFNSLMIVFGLLSVNPDVREILILRELKKIHLIFLQPILDCEKSTEYN